LALFGVTQFRNRVKQISSRASQPTRRALRVVRALRPRRPRGVCVSARHTEASAPSLWTRRRDGPSASLSHRTPRPGRKAGRPVPCGATHAAPIVDIRAPLCMRLYNWPRRRRNIPRSPRALLTSLLCPVRTQVGPAVPCPLTSRLAREAGRARPAASPLAPCTSLHAPVRSGLQGAPTPSSGCTGGRPRGSTPPTPDDPTSTRETTSNHPTKVSRSPGSGPPAKSDRPRPPIPAAGAGRPAGDYIARIKFFAG
jgi:hypothetical protein